MLIYANFITHHVMPDMRVPLAIGLLAATWGTWVHFTVGARRYRMPLAVSFLLIGAFLWLAENLGTLLDTWRYPEQAHGWQTVHVGKLGSWALLVVLSFVLVAVWKGSRLREELRSPAAAPAGALPARG